MKFLVLLINLLVCLSIFGQYSGGYYDNSNELTITFRPQINFDNTRQFENERVNNHYVPNAQVAGNVVASINNSSNELQQRLNELNDRYIGFGDDFSSYLTNMGAALNLSHQDEFIKKILSSTGGAHENSLVQVAPFLDNAPFRKFNSYPIAASKINQVRLKVSKYLSNVYEHCEKTQCNTAMVSVMERGLNQVLNMALENAQNSEFLKSWGEDVSQFEKTMDSLNDFLSDSKNINLESLYEQSLEQEHLKRNLRKFHDEWEFDWVSTEQTQEFNDVEVIADKIFSLKKCVALGSCSEEALLEEGVFLEEKKLINNIIETQESIENYRGEELYNEVAQEFLDISVDGLSHGDTKMALAAQEIAQTTLDIGLGFVPVVSIGKDIYELVLGKNLVTGEQLGTLERSFAAVGILTLGGSNYVKAGLRGLSKLGPVAKKGLNLILKKADEIVSASGDIIKNIGRSKFNKVLRTPWGNRPEPSTYLSSKYIKNHLSEFDDGASRFIKESTLRRYGAAQSDGTAFVLPKKEADRIIKQANGDIRKLEESLGYPSGAFENNKILRLDIPGPRNYNIRVPSGNEKGAFDDLWLPGGKLPNGHSEAVVDLGNVPLEELSVVPISFK